MADDDGMGNSTALAPAPPTKAQIRRAAILSALALLPVGVIASVCFGMPLRQAASASLAAVLSGQAAWWTFHLVGRRTDGLAYLAMGFPMAFPASAWSVPFWIALLVQVVVMVLLAWLTAKMVGALERTKPAPIPHPPLHDSQIDGA